MPPHLIYIAEVLLLATRYSVTVAAVLTFGTLILTTLCVALFVYSSLAYFVEEFPHSTRR